MVNGLEILEAKEVESIRTVRFQLYYICFFNRMKYLTLPRVIYYRFSSSLLINKFYHVSEKEFVNFPKYWNLSNEFESRRVKVPSLT